MKHRVLSDPQYEHMWKIFRKHNVPLGSLAGLAGISRQAAHAYFKQRGWPTKNGGYNVEAIKELRERYQMTDDQIADLFNISKTGVVGLIGRGGILGRKRPLPKVIEIMREAYGLGLTQEKIATLMGRSQNGVSVLLEQK